MASTRNLYVFCCGLYRTNKQQELKNEREMPSVLRWHSDVIVTAQSLAFLEFSGFQGFVTNKEIRFAHSTFVFYNFHDWISKALYILRTLLLHERGSAEPYHTQLQILTEDFVGSTLKTGKIHCCFLLRKRWPKLLPGLGANHIERDGGDECWW